MRYKTNDGELIEASSSFDVIKKLRALSRDQEVNMYTFMKVMAERVKQQTGIIIETRTSEQFVSGLLEAGLLKEEGD